MKRQTNLPVLVKRTGPDHSYLKTGVGVVIELLERINAMEKRIHELESRLV